eukprot:2977574-Pleurochrysis_carterae.AAC.6
MELANGPIYQEVRSRGKNMVRNLRRPSEGGDRCERGMARKMRSTHNIDEESDKGAELERQECRREREKIYTWYQLELRNGEIVGGGGEWERDATCD